MKIIIASGFFDPIHVGHIEYLKLAKELGDKLVAILNNDVQCLLKKDRTFMREEERVEIVRAIRYVDEVFLSVDKDKSVCESIRVIAEKYRGNEIIFGKGGDRFSYEIPETEFCKRLGIKIVDGLGKKIQSSSKLTGLKEIK
jgi:cytidyltransferase-like protein